MLSCVAAHNRSDVVHVDQMFTDLNEWLGYVAHPESLSKSWYGKSREQWVRPQVSVFRFWFRLNRRTGSKRTQFLVSEFALRGRSTSSRLLIYHLISHSEPTLNPHPLSTALRPSRSPNSSRRRSEWRSSRNRAIATASQLCSDARKPGGNQ
jgi:hypothetical protein